MNITLTDLQSLTLEVQEIPAVADSGGHNFTGMFHQQFPEVAKEGGQVVEFKEFIENIPLQADTSAVTLEASPLSVWGTPPTQVTTASDPVLPGLTEQVDGLVTGSLDPDPGGDVEARVAAETGELLPVSGNQLPQDRSTDTPVLRSLENTEKTPMTETVTPSASAATNVGAVQNPLPPAALTPSAAVLPSAGDPDPINPVITTNAITANVADGTDVVAPIGKIASPETVSAVVREAPVMVKPATDNGQPRPAGLIRELVAAAEVLPSRPEIAQRTSPQSPIAPLIAGRELGLDEPPKAARGIVSDARQIATAGVQPVHETLVDGGILRRDNMLASEPVPAREVTANTETRGFELPAQTAGNAAQQSVTPMASSTLAAPVPGVGNIIATTQQNPLPPQLESMSLARNADSTEWGNGLSERVNWMINQKQNSASIRLDPPALGKLEVQIKIVDDATTISIQTQTLQTRDLIESASVRLRDFLQESGYQNVSVDVSQRQDQQQARAQTTVNTNPDQDDTGDQEQSSDQQQQHVGYFSGDGLVDTFA